MNIKLKYKIPKTLKREILDFLLNSDIKFIEHGREKEKKLLNRFYKFDNFNLPIVKKIKIFSDEIFAAMNMNTTIESFNSAFIVSDSGYLQNHLDFNDKETGYLHVRVNFLLCKSEIGGNPIIENNVYEIDEDESWLICASLWTHGCEEVKGEKSRITLSLGKYVKPCEVKEFLKIFLYNYE